MLVEITGKRYQEIAITTSLKVAEKFEKQHKDVLESIRGLQSSMSTADFSALFSETTYRASNGKSNPMYEMNRDGFSLLAMGFTGEKALKWKLQYISAFNAMEDELKRIYTERQQWQIERDKGVVIRHILTDTIKMKIADSPHKRFAYPNYTNMIYRIFFGKPAKELEKEYGVKPKESLRDYFTGEDLERVQSAEMLVSSLISCGMGYDEIKTFVLSKANKLIGEG